MGSFLVRYLTQFLLHAEMHGTQNGFCANSFYYTQKCTQPILVLCQLCQLCQTVPNGFGNPLLCAKWDRFVNFSRHQSITNGGSRGLSPRDHQTAPLNRAYAAVRPLSVARTVLRQPSLPRRAVKLPARPRATPASPPHRPRLTVAAGLF